MKNRINISLVLTLVSVFATVFLFYYLINKESQNSLFLFNLGYTIFLEILFFGFIYFAKLGDNNILGATYSVLGSILIIYLLFGITILLGFNIIYENVIAVKWYYSSIIIGTLLTIILSGFSLKLNNNLVESNKREKKITLSRDSYVQNLTYLQSTYATILMENKIDEKLESGYSSVIQKLTNKLSFIDQKIIENSDCTIRLSDSIGTLENLIKEMKNSELDKTSIQKQITELVNDTIFYLNSLK